MGEYEDNKKKIQEKIDAAKKTIEKQLEDEKQKLLDEINKKAKRKKALMNDEDYDYEADF